jgi:ribosome-binding protein aMBF1 (putative translation factor)
MKTKTSTLNGVKLRNLEQLSLEKQAELEQAFNESEAIFTSSNQGSSPEISVAELQHTIETEVAKRRMGALLQEARNQAKLSGRATAKRLNMHHARLRKLEAADTNLEVGSFVRVAHELEFDVTIRLESRSGGKVLETKL